MKISQLALLVPATLALALAGCDRSENQAEAQRLAEERAALERDKAALEASKAAAQQADNEAEKARLEAERADLNREKGRLAAQRTTQAQAEQDARGAADREARMAAERRAAEETAARREAEVREREARENARDAADQARAEQTVSFFYDALDPYGDWIEIDRYGYAFRPSAGRDAGWRPYTDGGWVYTDCGWTWRSNEPFGWATYHYGRWARVSRLGWVWVPGTEWGPAWVSWRRSSDYVGWAPLPPDAWSSRGFNAAVDSYFDIGPGMYTFLRVVDFGEPTYVGRVVEPAQNVTIINQTTNVTNVVYKTVQNRTTIVNEGPDLTVINQRARQPVRRMNLERLATGAPQTAKVQGNTLQVVAPDLRKTGAVAKPKQVKGSVKAAELDRGWADAKADEAKVRADAAKEAHAAEQAERSEPKPAPVVKPAPAFATPIPRPERPAKPGLTQPEAATPEAVQPASPRPVRPGKPKPPVGELPPSEATPAPPARPRDSLPAATPVIPGREKVRPARPVVPEPGDVAPPTPPAPGDGRPQPLDRRPNPSRVEPVPPNRPEPAEAPLKKFQQPGPGATPASPQTPAADSTDPDAKPGRKKPKN